MLRFAVFWCILGFIGLLFLVSTINAQTRVTVAAWTPVEADTNQYIDNIKFFGKKWTINVRFKTKKQLVRVAVKQTVTDKKTGDKTVVTRWVNYDANGANIYLKQLIRRAGLNRLPKDSNNLLIKTMLDGDGRKSWWLFFEGADGLVWLSSLVKIKGNEMIRGEAKFYPLGEKLSLGKLQIDSVSQSSLIVKQNQKTFLVGSSGAGINLAGLAREIVALKEGKFFDKKFLSVISRADTNWIIFNQDGPEVCGSQIGFVNHSDSSFTAGVSDSLEIGKIFFNGYSLKVLWADGNFYSMPIGSDEELSQVDFQPLLVGRAKTIEVKNFGKKIAIAWPLDGLVTPPIDTVYRTRLTNNLLVFNQQENFLAVVKATGNLQLLDYNEKKKIRDIKMSTLQTEVYQAEQFKPYFEIDEDVAVVSYEDDGDLDSMYLWADKGRFTEYYGKPIYSNVDSIYLFKADKALIQVDATVLKEQRFYHLPKIKDKNIYSFEVKKIGRYEVFEIGYQGGVDWVFPLSGFICSKAGEFMGYAEFDSSVYVFLDWKKLSLIYTSEWQDKVYTIDADNNDLPVKLTDYSAVVYEWEDYYTKVKSLRARVVCTVRRENGKFSYDQTFIMR